MLPVQIDNVDIENVKEYKYLGTIIDDKLTWNSNTDFIYKKARKRLYLLHKLKRFHVDDKILFLFYRTCIQSIITFNFLCWYKNLSVKNKNKILKIVNVANKVTGVLTDLSLFHDDHILKEGFQNYQRQKSRFIIRI